MEGEVWVSKCIFPLKASFEVEIFCQKGALRHDKSDFLYSFQGSEYLSWFLDVLRSVVFKMLSEGKRSCILKHAKLGGLIGLYK